VDQGVLGGHGQHVALDHGQVGVHDDVGLGLQRARTRSLTLRAEDLRPSDTVDRQLLFDPVDERRRRPETVTDQVRIRFASARLYPASLGRVA
jgi:hypothetical protein